MLATRYSLLATARAANLAPAKSSIEARRFFVVLGFTQGLEIPWRPEERGISAMGDDVIGDGGRLEARAAVENVNGKFF
jgi:hypothetical protein